MGKNREFKLCKIRDKEFLNYDEFFLRLEGVLLLGLMEENILNEVEFDILEKIRSRGGRGLSGTFLESQ